MMTDQKSQLDKFKEAARQLEADDDEDRFEEKLHGIVKQKPLTDNSESDLVSGDDGADGER